MSSPSVSVVFPREHPAGAVIEVATLAEGAGLDGMWVIEDCFYTAGVSLAAAALTATSELSVGLGIMPAVARNPAITAMEIATLGALAPGRFTAGIGHGVQEWMGQMGVRPSSPLTTLEETLVVVRRLLAGERVTFDGATVTLNDVALDAPADPVPSVLAGVRKERSLALAGRAADGLVLAEGTGPTALRQALATAGRTNDPEFAATVFTPLCVLDDAVEARRVMAGFVRGLVLAANPAMSAHPHLDAIKTAMDAGDDALAELPDEVWIEIGAIGTPDDAAAHVSALADAGADDVALFLAPDDLELAMAQIPEAAEVKRLVGHGQ